MFVGSGDLDSGPHTCVVEALAEERLLAPWGSFLCMQYPKGISKRCLCGVPAQVIRRGGRIGNGEGIWGRGDGVVGFPVPT